MRHMIAGVPAPQRWLVTTTGGRYDFPSSTIRLQVIVHSGTVRLYFSKAAYDADVGAPALAGTGEATIELDAASPPYEGPAWVTGVWMRGVGGDAVVTVVPFASPPGAN